MFRTILSASALLFVFSTVGLTQEASGDGIATQAQTEEALAWDAVKDSGSSAEVFAFIESYPSGTFTTEAQALMIDLLWAEMEKTDTDVAEAPETVEPTPEQLLAVTFTDRLTTGDPEIIGQSIEELIAGNPLFPPVEGLPASYWEEQQCSNCHEWERANLCTQANTYLSDAGAANLDKPHPYGGTFKENLLAWATGGCQ